MRENRLVMLGLWVCLVSGIVAGGCRISPGANSAEPGKLVKSRARAYWVAIDEGRFQDAYDGYVCDKSRDDLTRREFIGRMARLPYSNIKVMGVTIAESGKQAEVELQFDASMMGRELPGMKMRQQWIFENGEWRLKLNASRTPFE